MKPVALRDKDLATLRATFRRFPAVREVRVFGSRATGTARRASDLDLAISAPEAPASEWQAVLEALEEAPIVYSFDIVRMEDTQNPRLLAAIERDGVAIYPEVDQP